MRERLHRILPPLAGIAVFATALEVLRRELHAVSWRMLVADVFATAAIALLSAIALAALNYGVLTGTNFIMGNAGTTVAISGKGVTVGTVKVMSTTLITTRLTIAPTAVLGGRIITVTTTGGKPSMGAFFSSGRICSTRAEYINVSVECGRIPITAAA